MREGSCEAAAATGGWAAAARLQNGSARLGDARPAAARRPPAPATAPRPYHMTQAGAGGTAVPDGVAVREKYIPVAAEKGQVGERRGHPASGSGVASIPDLRPAPPPSHTAPPHALISRRPRLHTPCSARPPSHNHFCLFDGCVQGREHGV